MRASGVEGTIAVQARQTTEETEWLLDLAAQPSLYTSAWSDGSRLSIPRCDGHLERFAQNPKLKAVRHVLHDEPDDLYMLRDDFNRGVSLLRNFGLAYDILIFERHLPQTLTFVDRHPRTDFRDRSYCETQNPGRSDLTVAGEHEGAGKARKRLLQSLRHGD